MIHQVFAKQITEIIDSSVGKGKRYRNYGELAKSAGVSSAVFSRYRKGQFLKPRSSILEKLSVALGCGKDYLQECWNKHYQRDLAEYCDHIFEIPFLGDLVMKADFSKKGECYCPKCAAWMGEI